MYHMKHNQDFNNDTKETQIVYDDERSSTLWSRWKLTATNWQI